MKKSIIAIALLSSVLVLNSCKGKEETTETTTESTAPVEATTTTTEETVTPASEPKSYTVVVAPGTPETVLLGKNKEAAVKITNMKAIELSEPDGKVTGIEFSYEYEVTNNNKIGGSGIVMDPNYFRLVLDNGNKISHSDYDSLSIDAEATKATTEGGNKFKLPAGTKAVALNLFFNETSATLKLEMK